MLSAVDYNSIARGACADAYRHHSLLRFALNSSFVNGELSDVSNITHHLPLTINQATVR
jgi:hypothetical protein